MPSAAPVYPGSCTLVSNRWRRRTSPPAPVPDWSAVLPWNFRHVVKFSPEVVPLLSWKPCAVLFTAKVPGSAIVLLVTVALTVVGLPLVAPACSRKPAPFEPHWYIWLLSTLIVRSPPPFDSTSRAGSLPLEPEFATPDVPIVLFRKYPVAVAVPSAA